MTEAAAIPGSNDLPLRRCGASGVVLPAVSLGLWHNFGVGDDRATMRALVRRAFERGIFHFDLANNYGPPPGAAEAAFGEILRSDLAAHRDELVVTTKAGFLMHRGPYGDGGSRKYLLTSLDRSLQRLGLDHVDIYYHHRPDPHTPLEETMGALAHAVRSGRTLYAGVSNYPAALARRACALLRALGTPCVVHQARYNLLDREAEAGLLDVLTDEGVGCVAFSPLAQGLLSERYLGGTPPAGSRATRSAFLSAADLTPATLRRVRALAAIAAARGQPLAEMALAWLLRRPVVASVLIGASSPGQIDAACRAAGATPLSEEELAAIDAASMARASQEQP